MSNYNDVNENTANDISKKAGKPVKKALGKLAKRAGKAIGKAARKAILSLLKILMPYILGGLGVAIVGVLGYFIIFEFVGTEKQYSPTSDNTLTQNEEGVDIATDSGMSFENTTIRDFYRYFSERSYFQIVGDDNTKLIYPDDEGAVEDYYKIEDTFKLNSNLLFSLDKYLFNDDFKYPEQSTKPIKYNPETLELVQLTNEKGILTAESFEEDPATGIRTGKMISSVRDYGLASVIKYNMTEEWTRIKKIKGSYVQKDIWDDELKKVVTVTMAAEPFEEILPGFPEKIYIIDKVISFKGELDYTYEYQENKVGTLNPGIAVNESDDGNKKAYSTHSEPTITGEVYDEYGVPMPVYGTPVVYTLYKYRSEDSGIIERLPVQTGVVTSDKGMKYFEDYINHFESYVPVGTLTDFKLNDRIDYESSIFDYEGILTQDNAVSMGTGLESKKFLKSYSYLPIIERHARDFGVDPYVILAMLTQESGGVANINGNGLMQITSGDAVVKQTAVRADGVTETVSVSYAERQDPEKSIRYAVAYVKRLMDIYDGNVYKAIQAYNLGEGTMGRIKTAHPEYWNSPSGWMLYREEARMASFKPSTRSASYGCMAFPSGIKTTGAKVGDSCYLENVMQYYAGNAIENIKDTGGIWASLKTLGTAFMSFVTPRVVAGAEATVPVPKLDYTKGVHSSIVNDIINTTVALDAQVYFSEANEEYESYADISFWDEGFMSSMTSIGGNIQDIMSITKNSEGFLPPIILGNGAHVTSKFGPRPSPTAGASTIHKGVDIGAKFGTSVYAVAPGTVVIAEFNKYRGNYVKIDHGNGTTTYYAHLSTFAVTVNGVVTAGQVVGKVGSTGISSGAHLHFELQVNNNAIDPLSIVMNQGTTNTDSTLSLRALEIAKKQLGKPYDWDANGPDSFDCSGLIEWSYNQAGYYDMARSTAGQWQTGKKIEADDIQIGDLIYFLNNEDNAAAGVDHVGIYVGNDQMIHAPSPGKNVEIRQVYWPKLVVIRRH